MSESLEDIGKRLRRAMSDAATGPLIAAADVIAISEEWDASPSPLPTSSGQHAINGQPAASYREQAGGGTCDNWLKTKGIAPGGLPFFVARHKAVLRLGEASRRTVHHQVAVWVDHNVPDALLSQCKTELIRGCKAQNGNPLTLAQAKRALSKLLGRKPVTRVACKRCAVLEQLAKEHGLSVPE